MSLIDPNDKEQVERLNKRMLYVLAGIILLVSFAGLLALKKQDRTNQVGQLASSANTPPSGEPWYRAKPDSLLFERAARAEPELPKLESKPQTREVEDQARVDRELQAMAAPLLVSVRKPDFLRPAQSRELSSSQGRLAEPTVPTNTIALDANLQFRKEAFLEKAERAGIEEYLPEVLNEPLSQFELKAGSVIPAVLVTEINSDLPGDILAQVRENVFDSATGGHLLIPQGAKLIGSYDSQVAFGQSRVLVVWSRLIYPDGRSITLRGMPGVDGAGATGFSDQVDNHYGRIFGGALLLSAISAGAQLSQPQSGAFDNDSPGQVAAGALGQQLGQVSGELIRKNVDVQPTLRVRAGYRLSVMVNRDIIISN